MHVKFSSYLMCYWYIVQYNHRFVDFQLYGDMDIVLIEQSSMQLLQSLSGFADP